MCELIIGLFGWQAGGKRFLPWNGNEWVQKQQQQKVACSFHFLLFLHPSSLNPGAEGAAASERNPRPSPGWVTGLLAIALSPPPPTFIFQKKSEKAG